MPLIIPKRQIDLKPNVSFKPKMIGEEHFARLAFNVAGAVLPPRSSMRSSWTTAHSSASTRPRRIRMRFPGTTP